MIYIKYMTYEAISVLKYDIKKHEAKNINEKIKENLNSSSWLNDFVNVDLYEEVKFPIEEFSLKYTEGTDNKENDYDNAITLYEHLNKLPRYILTDERFWAWLNFDIGYKYAVRRVPVKSKSTVGDHYLFNAGNRRGCFFGVLSRLYFWVDLTIDYSNKEDKYALTKFAISNIERIRTLTWRSNSNEKHIVRGVLKAELKLFNEYQKSPELSERFKKAESGINGVNLYTEIAKYISLYGSVRLLDTITEEEYVDIIYDAGKKLIDDLNK